MIKTSLIYLFVGILLGLLTFVSGRIPELAWISSWRTVHVHLILVGSVIQIIMGVALWMFPRRKEPPGWTTEREGMTLYVSTEAMQTGILEQFKQAIAKKKFDKEDVIAGWEHVAGYVEFVHYVERSYEATKHVAQGHYPEPAGARPHKE